MKIKYIITHPGSAHKDEFLSIALIIAQYGVKVPIYRREPTVEELNDPEIWIIDIGREYNEKLNNYDHHQFEKNQIKCSVSLILNKFDLYYPLYSQWIKTVEILDSKGPNELAKYYGIKIENLNLTMSHIENIVLEEFESETEILSNTFIYELLERIGKRTIGHIKQAKKQIKEARNVLEIEKVGKIDVMFFKEIVHPATAHVLRNELQEKGKDIAVSVMPDNRSEGWKLFRYYDHNIIDFTKCKDDSRITFAHVNGFVCITDKRYNKDIIKELIMKAHTN